MCRRGYLFVVCMVLVVGCARARPGDNDIIAAPPGKASAVTVTKSEAPVKKAEEPVAEADIPVNQKYPSAVLFGGTCGGTIISAKWVLTAGHCTLFTGGRYVLAGTNNSDDGSGVSVRVKRLVIHPLFTVGPYWLDADQFHIKQVAARWDFLLAELEDPLPLNGKTIVAATLDEKPSELAGLDVGYAGYGTEHHGGVMRSEMHGMELTVQTDAVCSSLEQYNPKDMLCSKGRPPRFDSACNGDSGTGLLDGSGRVVGVTSWVEDDAHECRKGALVVFARVAAARDWIRQVTKI